MSPVCKICGKEFKNTQGLRGHMTFVHGQAGSSKILSAPAATEQPVSRLRARLGLTPSNAQPTTAQQVIRLEDRLQKLERVTGLRESDLLDSPTDGQLPITEQLGQLTQQLGQLTQQLGQLTQQVNKISEDVEMTQVAKALSDKCLAQLDKVTFQLESLKDAHNKLVAVVNNNSEQLKKSTAMFEGKLGSDERDLHETNKRLDKVEAQLVKDRDAFKSIEQTVNSVKTDIDDIRLRMLRKPTDHVVSLRLTDGRDHRFREYRGPQGLRRPHKTVTDWILGDKFVDLSEPED